MADFNIGDQILIHNCDVAWWNGKEGVVTKLIVDRDDMMPYCCYIGVQLEGERDLYEIAVAQHEIQLKGGPW